MTGRSPETQGALANDDFYSGAFSFYSHVSGDVDPRTGMYSAGIDLTTGKGNQLRGPSFEFRLNYDALSSSDDGFGTGWLLGITRLERDIGMLVLGSGDSHRFDRLFPGIPSAFPDRKLESFRLTAGNNGTAVLEHATGVIEYLAPAAGSSSSLRPQRIVNPSGDAIHLTWESGPHGTPVLTRVGDDEGQPLLILSYPDRGNIHLTIFTGLTAPVELHFSRLGDTLQRVRIPALTELNAQPVRDEEEAVWAFGYKNSLEPPYLALLNSVTSPDGIHDVVSYAEESIRLPPGAGRRYMPAVAERRRVLDAERTTVLQTSRYAYNTHGDNNYLGHPLVTAWENRNDQLLHHGNAEGFVYGSRETQVASNGDTLCTIERTYNHFHLIARETTTRGTVVQEVETVYGEERGVPFVRQKKSFQLPHSIVTTLYDKRDPTLKQVTIADNTYDDDGNLISHRDGATGIVERSAYFPLDGESGLCPPDPLGLAYRLKSETVEPGPGGGPVLTTRYRYCELPVRVAAGATRFEASPRAPTVYVQACAETLSEDDRDDPLSHSEQRFIVDQGERHGALSQESRTQDGLTLTRDFDYRTDTGRQTIVTRVTETTFDGVISTTEEEVALVGGQLRGSMDALGNHTYTIYDNLSRPKTQSRARGREQEVITSEWRYQVSTTSRWVERRGVTGLPHRTWLDEQGRVTVEEEPLPDGSMMTVREVTYDHFGQVLDEVLYDRLASDAPLRLRTEFKYDDWGRCSDRTAPDGSHARSETALVEVNGEIVTRTTAWQEADGRRIGGWQSTDTDAAGRQRRAAYGIWDDEGAAREVAMTQWRYDGLGRCIETIDPVGLVTAQHWDVLGRLTETTLSDGTAVAYTFAAGHEEALPTSMSVTPADGAPALRLGRQDWDGLGRLLSETSGSLTRRYDYGPDQFNAASEHLPAGGEIRRTYDPWLNEAVLTETLASEPPVVLRTAAYDAIAGMPKSIRSESGEMRIDTDYLGRMTEQTVTMGGTSRSCEVSVSPCGVELVKSGIDGATQVFHYDDCGRTERIQHMTKEGLGLVDVTFAYDGLSRPTSRTATTDAGGSVTESLEYDDLGRVVGTTWLAERAGERTRRKLVLEWRKDGKVAGKRWFGNDDVSRLREETMEYDRRGRLVVHAIDAIDGEYPVDEAGHAYRVQRFDYDSIDNLRSVETTLVDGRLNRTTYGYDAIDLDRLVGVESSLAGYPGYGTPLVVRYDDNGNVIEDGLGNVLTWDAASRLASVTSANNVRADYAYGPDGRIGQVVQQGRSTLRYYDDGQLYGEFDDDEQRRYLRSGGTVVAESVLSRDLRKTWLLGSDPQGSVILETGDAVATRTYGAYGDRNATSDAARSGFAGEVCDTATGWYLLGERPYSPALRRFLSPDRASPFGAGGVNRYAYCAGDPINRIDPTGRAWWDWLGFALGAIGAAVAVVATGGALLGVVAAAAAGSLTAAVSTPTMMVMAAAAVLEVTSVAVEVGALASAATGDEQTAGILGWIAFGTGLASGAMSVAPKMGATPGRFVGARRSATQGATGRTPTVTATTLHPGSTNSGLIEAVHPLGGKVNHYVGAPAVSAQIPNRIILNDPDKINIAPQWFKAKNAAGGTVYFTDTMTNGTIVGEVMDAIAKKRAAQKSKHKIIGLTGGHGNALGDNYKNGIRVHADSRFQPEDNFSAANAFFKYGNPGLKIRTKNIAGKSPAKIRKWLSQPGDIIVGHCYSAADPIVMEVLNLKEVTVYTF
ncbi:RHS repeat-associated core domain-containing protein [Luteibacter sp. 22Crub2.1]|nr:RHS repeat-associated core domain-containing protein [Luteibacter sp. 22Crub2.1]